MRVRLPLGRTLFFLCAFLFAIVALLPLRFAVTTLGLDRGGFAAREVEGSIWTGIFREAQWNGSALGDLRARLATLPLLAGRARVELRGTAGAPGLDGALVATRHTLGIADMTARIAAPGFLAPLPIASLDLSDLDASFSDAGCLSAKGGVSATFATSAGLPLAAAFSGTARCEGGSLFLPLHSPDGAQTAEIRIYPGGRYAVRLTLLPSGGASDAALAAAGFVSTNGGYIIDRQGRF